MTRAHDLDTAHALRALSIREQDTPFNLTRRRFLQAAGALGGGAALATAPGWAQEAFAAAPVGPNEGILVMLMMAGGNDGLNTVVPYIDGNYYSRRPYTSIPPDQVLPLDGRVGLHPNLVNLKNLYDQNQVAVVQGVGYPNPDLSHFSSMAIWMRAWAGAGTPGTGWLGRWLDYVGADPFHAIHLGQSIPLHMAGASRKASALGTSRPFGTSSDGNWVRLHNGINSFAAASTGTGQYGDALVAAQRDHLSLAAAAGPSYTPALPTGRLIGQLTLAARLINANLGTRILSLGWGDFDSHDGHRAMHDARMAEFDSALASFWATLSPQWANRVTIMTFSEFGRRLPENGNRGTDHGTGGMQLLIGPQVRGGIHGSAPSLSQLDSHRSPIASTHFNQVYASVLTQWLGADPQTILGTNPDQLALFGAGPGVSASGPGPGPTPPGDLMALSPNRRLDTRIGLGISAAGPLGPGAQVDLLVTGAGGVPNHGVLAAVLNVTAVTPTEAGYLTVWPAGEGQPGSSNLNFLPGEVVPNLVMCKIGPNGRVSIRNANGHTDVVADVVGYIKEGSDTNLLPTQPVRLLDTRDSAPVGPGGDIELTVVGGTIPWSGVQSVVLNVTATGSTSASFLTVYPNGQPRPWSSNLNFLTGQTVPNLVVAKVGDGGKVRFFNAEGNSHVVVDLLGYVCTATSGTGRVVALTPARVLDTREGWAGGPLIGGVDRMVSLAGVGGLPAGTFSGVIANITVTGGTDFGYLTVWPANQGRPLASNLNFGPGQTVPNLVVSAVSPDGHLGLFAPFGQTHVIIDLVGYIT
ncbi:MAG: DUF1501 domain-containing protein [Acidimicrobiales bacterium]